MSWLAWAGIAAAVIFMLVSLFAHRRMGPRSGSPDYDPWGR